MRFIEVRHKKDGRPILVSISEIKTVEFCGKRGTWIGFDTAPFVRAGIFVSQSVAEVKELIKNARAEIFTRSK